VPVFGGDGERFGYNVIRSTDGRRDEITRCGRGIVRIQVSSGLPCHDASLASGWRYRQHQCGLPAGFNPPASFALRYQTADGLIYDLERLRRCPALSCPRSRQCMSHHFPGEIPHGHAVVEIANAEPLRGAMSGSSQGAVEIGCSERTVRRWVATYRDHGEAGLVSLRSSDPFGGHCHVVEPAATGRIRE
jgi:hypothetical protein